jgi:hypothetical protein
MGRPRWWHPSLGRTARLALLLSVSLIFAAPARAAAVHVPWQPNWHYTNGFYDEHDFSDPGPSGCGDPDTCEWGIDVPLQHGTPIYAPEVGTIIGYEQWSFHDQCGTAWCPGRLLEQLGDGSGAVVAFGHVNALVTSGPVSAGQEIGTVAWNSGNCAQSVRCDPGDGDHVEFMYDPNGQNYNSRSSYLPASSVSPSNDCPNRPWSGGGAGADPCAVLRQFMLGKAPPGPADAVRRFAGGLYSDALFLNRNGAGINAYVAQGGSHGLGGFTPVPGYANAFDPARTRVVTGDFNGDGYADVFFINHNGAGINAYVARGGSHGLGGFTPLAGYRGAFGPARTKVVAGDFNGDGSADILFINHNGAGINAYVARGGSHGLGGFTPLAGYRGAFDPARTLMESGDYNGDGSADILFINHNGAGINAYQAFGGSAGIGAFSPLGGYTNAFDPASTKLPDSN